jgi:hypothetical protein
LNLGSFTDNQFDEWLQMIQSMTDLDQWLIESSAMK